MNTQAASNSNLSKVVLDPNELTTTEKYKLLIGIIVPRPIAFVSTLSKDGVANLAPFSFFNGVSTDPPCIAISVTARGSDGTPKDTTRNIEASGEFVVNVVTEDYVETMNQTAGEYPPKVSEFTAAGFTPTDSVIIKPPRVAESPINMECKLYKSIQIGDGGIGSSTLMIGEIVRYHIREDLFSNGRIDLQKYRPVGRLAGTDYCTVHQNTFNIPRFQIEK